MSREAMKQEPMAWQCQCGKAYTVTCISSKPPKREWVPEALRLADALDAEFVQGRISNSTGRESAVELRRLALKQWVGLTDEEIAQGLKESWVTEQAWQSAVWWAEAKLKEKNT